MYLLSLFFLMSCRNRGAGGGEVEEVYYNESVMGEMYAT